MADVAVDTHFAGKTLGELQLRKKYGVNVVAVRRRREEVRDDGSVDVSLHVDNFVGPDTTVAAGDTMVVVGSNDAVRALAAVS